MTISLSAAASRRLFLQFLAASPLWGISARVALAEEALKVPEPPPDPILWGPQGIDGVIKSPQEAINVFDFELAAHQNVPLAHFASVASGTDGEVTMRANRADLAKVQLRPRRLRNVSKIDAGMTLFGTRWASPIFICPTGGGKVMHPDGEIAVSKAAEAGKHLQMISTYASISIEDAMAARGGTPIWFQLYPTSSFAIAKDVTARAERAGAPVLVITVDWVKALTLETFERLKRLDHRPCEACHQSAEGGTEASALSPNYAGIAHERWKGVQLFADNVDWDFVRRLRDGTKMKVLIKGIMTPEDAALCVKYGLDGVVVSNHGGRADDIGMSTISVLPEVVAAVRGKIPVLVDSGFRRGTDVVKALAMGATAVGIGRPYLWGLGAFGQPGVERVLEILRTETQVSMAEMGAPTIKDLVPDMVQVG